MSAHLLGEERFSTAIGEKEILQQCYWRRRESPAVLLGEERSYGTVIGGGDKLRQCYWGRSEASALLLSEASALLLGGRREVRHCYLGEEQRFKKQNQNKQRMLNW